VDLAPVVPQRRLIAIGASNLTRLLPALVGRAEQLASGPVQVLAAAGFGRSYGIRSHFLVRALPGIDDCGLFTALAASPPLPATAILMDVGNDVLYGFDVPTILRWVDDALTRLRPHAEHLVVAGLPPRLDRVGALRFELVRTLLVPGCPLSRQQALQRSQQLASKLPELAGLRGASFVSMREAWYGFDPIHVRRRHRQELAAGLLPGNAPGIRTSVSAIRLWRARPERRWFFGREQRAPQPAVRFATGTTVALY
jgi:hypothetical protein